jgi:sulfonate transport system substrate-binding protein
MKKYSNQVFYLECNDDNNIDYYPTSFHTHIGEIDSMNYIFLLIFGCQSQDPAATSEYAASSKIPLRVGWQQTWATQGQLAVILQQSNILQDLGFAPTFIGFSYGAPLNEAALAGEVDVLFTADQPALALCNRDSKWKMIGRLMYNRVGTFVSITSPIQSIRDLQKKSIAIPFGAAAHRETLGAIKQSGLDPKKDITTVNMGIQDIATMVVGRAWNSIDAASAWDPVYADLESKKLIRSLAQGTVTSVVVMNQTYFSTYPDSPSRFLEGLQLAYQEYKSDTKSANDRFIKASQLSFSTESLDLAASVEPNLQPNQSISVTLSKDNRQNIQKASDFMHEAGLLPEKLDSNTCFWK